MNPCKNTILEQQMETNEQHDAADVRRKKVGECSSAEDEHSEAFDERRKATVELRKAANKRRMEEQMRRKEEKNRQLEAMLAPARERLRRYTIEDICARAYVSFDQETQCIFFETMGRTVHIHVPDFVILEELDMWHYLTLLQYLDTADGSLLNDNWIGLQQMPGGLARGYGFDKDFVIMFKRYFTGMSAARFQQICGMIGGEVMEGKADVTMKISYAPQFPVVVNFWEGDDEFPPSGKLLVNEFADHYLTIEAAGGACAAVVEKLHEVSRTLSGK